MLKKMENSRTTFIDKYEQISSTNDFKGKFNNTFDKVCKFCLKTSKEATFKNIPHVIPELLGRNNYTSNDECDNCNKLFGTYESDLANYISPYQTLIGQKTKTKKVLGWDFPWGKATPMPMRGTRRALTAPALVQASETSGNSARRPTPARQPCGR